MLGFQAQCTELFLSSRAFLSLPELGKIFLGLFSVHFLKLTGARIKYFWGGVMKCFKENICQRTNMPAT